jgi:hypothetical protein
MNQPPPISRHYPVDNKKDSLLFWCFFGLLGTYVIEGPLRYALVLAGHPNLIYTRDGVAAISIAYVFIRSLLTKNWIESNISIVLYILLFHFAIGVIWGLPIFQVFFGLKIFLTLLLGIAVYPVLQRRFPDVLLILAFFFVITVLGIFYNYAVQKFPWEGMKYETAFGTVTSTREWWTGGVRRLPGLARTSFDAATICGISGFACLILLKNIISRLFFSVVTITSIILTTTKGILSPFLLITFWMTFKNHNIFLPLGRMLVIVLLLVSILLPLVAVIFEFGRVFKAHELPSFLSSLWERFDWMWPEAFNLLNSPEKYLFGGGLGSIGTPQKYGDDLLHLNAGDNVFVLFFVLFGPIGVFYLAFPAWQLFRSHYDSHRWIWSTGILILCYGYGITANIFENPFFSCLLGVVYGFFMDNKRQLLGDNSYSNRFEAKL